MRYRLGTISLAATTLLLSLSSPLLPLDGFEPIAAQAQTTQDRKAEADRLFQQAYQQFKQKQYEAAIGSLQQALTIYRAISERKQEAEVLFRLGDTYKQVAPSVEPTNQSGWGLVKDYSKAIEFYQQALAAYRAIGERNKEAEVLISLGNAYKSGKLKSYPRVIEFYQQALAVYQALGERKQQAQGFIEIGSVYQLMEDYPKAIASYQEALAIYRALGERKQEAAVLIELGNLHNGWGLSNYPTLIDYYQQALAIYQAIGDREGEAKTLIALGKFYRLLLKDYPKAIASYQQALAVLRDIDNPQQETAVLHDLSRIYWNLKDYPKAIEAHQQAAAIFRKFGKREWEVKVLVDLSILYYSIGQYQTEKELHQQVLTSSRTAGGRKEEMLALTNLAASYENRHHYSRAIEFSQQALTVARTIGDQENEINGLVFLGDIYLRVGPYPKAIESYQRAVELYQSRQKSDTKSARILGSVGIAYHRRGQYAEAIQAYQQALNLNADSWGADSRNGDKTIVIANLSASYHALGQYQKAIDLYQQALALLENQWKSLEEAVVLDGLGTTYQALGKTQDAIETYQQALNLLSKEIDKGNWTTDEGDWKYEGNGNHKAIVLNHLGTAYQSLGQTQTAIESHQQALAIFREISNRGGEANALNNLGELYRSMGQNDKALAFYQQSLAIKQNIGDREGEGRVLSNLGELLAKQNQPELAIVFYKQSVNLRESIRGNIRALPEEFQQSYTQTVADTYRQLAELLLQQDRVLEAQEVLDLLKLQELEDYLRNVRGNLKATQELDFWEAEQRILKLYDQWIVQNQNAQFDAFVNSPEVTALVAQLRRTARGQNLNPEQLARLQDNLQALDKAALLYPLILEDRVELVLVTPSSLVRKTVKVDRVKLNEAIANFLSDITDPYSNPTANAQQLYQWLIQPLEDDLEQAQVNTILYAADRQLRYIPLAALHDGKQWLIQRFTLNHITAASLTNFNRNGDRPLQILAAAFSDPQLSYQFQIGEDHFDFNGLKFAGVEVETITKEIPGTMAFFNKDFKRDNVEPRLGEHSIVHLATHAEFVSKSPHESFILFGSGERVTLADIDKWKLSDVDLVVLSACRTAASTSGELGSGEEILGFGYQIQRTGAEAAIASLWSVDDGGTQALMNAFYTALLTGKMTKAKALRQAQIAVITDDYSALGEPRGIVGVRQRIRNRLSSQVANRLSHPYYWAPFILIGNGL